VEFLTEYGLFLAKALTVVVAVLAIVAGTAAVSLRGRGERRDRIEVKSLNDRYRRMADAIRSAALNRKGLRKLRRGRRSEERRRKAADQESQRRIFVVDFHGDIRASAVSSLREEITAILTVAEPSDEVLCRLESAGGVVHGYGLAASQLLRIRERGLTLTVAVDKVAASGGYMMACVADRIVAAPFAVVGSIGVVSQLPNFNRLLRRNDIDYELFTAGDYKRTVTVFGENTDAGRRKHQEDIEDAHRLFKEFVQEHRNQVDIERVSTGEHWFGRRALDLALVDELRTSDDYLLAAHAEAKLFEVKFHGRKRIGERLADLARALGDRPLGSF
jgi:serine protease SohB